MQLVQLAALRRSGGRFAGSRTPSRVDLSRLASFAAEKALVRATHRVEREAKQTRSLLLGVRQLRRMLRRETEQWCRYTTREIMQRMFGAVPPYIVNREMVFCRRLCARASATLNVCMNS